MFDEWARRQAAPVLTPVARWLDRVRVTPNQVTVCSFLVAVGAALAIGFGQLHAGLALWLISRLGDGLDGVLARTAHAITARGAFLDITLDMAAYSGMIVAFTAQRPDLGLVFACILTGYVLSITTTLALAAGAERLGRTVSLTNRTFQFTPSLAEGGETTAMYVIWLLAPGATGATAWLWCLVVFVSVIQRSALAWRALDSPRTE
ncbi:MAG: CDP-alcohol phosphatidyltransferase family protein [Dehalococcoidia bacterium]